MILQCSQCGKVKKFLDWIEPPEVLIDVKDIRILKVTCPKCKEKDRGWNPW